MVGGDMPHSVLSTGWLMRFDVAIPFEHVGALDIADQIVAAHVVSANNRASDRDSRSWA